MKIKIKSGKGCVRLQLAVENLMKLCELQLPFDIPVATFGFQ